MGRKKREQVSAEQIIMNEGEMINMEEMNNVAFEQAEEMVVEGTIEDVVVPEKRVFLDGEGKEISCSAFCRLKFAEDMTKRQIADEFDIPYRTVYGACQNMENNAAAEKRGRTVTEATITVDSEGSVYAINKDGVTLKNGIATDEAVNFAELESIERKTWITEKFNEGLSRADIAGILGVSHGVVYNATKELGTTRQSTKITLEDGTEVERAEHIRNLVAGGMEKKDVAKLLGVEYNVVYQATKVTKSTQDKYITTLEGLAKFADHVAEEDKAAFLEVIESLKGIVFPVATEEVMGTEEA